MDLPDIKALRELLKLLRSQGVTNYNSTDLQLVLSETAPTPQRSKATEVMEEAGEEDLSPEQEIERLMSWNDKVPASTESES